MGPTRISVVLGAYNGERFIGAQLASIGAQTRPPDRLFIVDDHSTDGTLEVAERFAASAPFRVDVKRHASNVGFIANFGRGLELAAETGPSGPGSIVVLCDQDDVWRADRLARIEAAFGASPDAGLVFSDADLVDEELRPIGQTLWDAIGLTRTRRRAARDGRLFEVLLRGTFVTGATMALRADYLPLLLPVRGRVGHDAWIALLLSAVAPAIALPERLVLYRQHGSNQIGARRPGLVERLRIDRESRLEALRERHVLHREALQRLRQLESPDHSMRLPQGLAARHRFTPERSRLLDASVAHLAARSSLPAPRLSRVPPVGRELLSGRYGRMSGGVPAAARDLLA